VWTTGGCASWYLDDQGRNTTLWPGSTWRFQMMYRDPQGPGGNGINATDGLSVTFCP